MPFPGLLPLAVLSSKRGRRGLSQNNITLTKSKINAMLKAAELMLLALAKATTKARMHHAVTSFIAAQMSAVIPSGDLVSPRSSKIRANTGNAVMLMETPMNNAKAGKVVPAPEKVGKRKSAVTTPSK